MPISLPDNPRDTAQKLKDQFEQLSTTKRRSIYAATFIIVLLGWFAWPSKSSSDGTKLFSPSTYPEISTRRVFAPTQLLTSEDYTEAVRPIDLENATAVFNTIYGALRNKEAQIYPIGVSFIPAYIPEGTLFYHGNGNGEIPTGLEWIAMDHEFSYSFIANRANGGKGRGGPDGEDRERGPGGPGNHGVKKGGIGGGGPGGPGGSGRNHTSKDHTSFLTFQTVRPLNKFILLDGSSASKSDTGEMDQQMILANVAANDSMREYEAAQIICDWGKPWGLDGFIRIEVGYEIVLCGFEEDRVKLVSNVTIDHLDHFMGLPDKIDFDEFEGKYKNELSELYNSISAVGGYDQIKQGNVHNKREGRILLDYRGMVTPLNRTWINPDTYLRRIHNISDELKKEVVTEIETYLSKGADPYSGTDWQLVVTETVDKFAPMLEILNKTLGRFDIDSTTDEQLLKDASNMTVFTSNFVRRFIDYALENNTDIDQIELAKKQAVYQYTHPLQNLQTESDVFVWSSITRVVQEIVDQVFEITFLTKKIIVKGYFNESPVSEFRQEYQDFKIKFTKLVETLNWSVYYQCDKVCAWDEVCYTPSWGPNPLGWGKSVFGTYEDESGKSRINRTEQCLSYRTILANKSWH